MITRRTRAIVRREYVTRVKSRWFLFTTLLVPVLMGGAVLVPAMLIGSEEEAPRVAVLDRAEGRPSLRLPETLRSHDLFAVELPAASPPTPRELAARLEMGEFDAVIVAPPDVFETGRVEVYTLGSFGAATTRRLETAAHEAMLLSLLSARGISGEDVERLLQGVEVLVRDLRAGAGGPSEAYQALGLFVSMGLYFMFLVYGQMITRGVQEEKSSDIVEILVSSVRPWEMMLGKLVGVGAVGLTQVAIWAALAGLFILFALASAAPFLAEVGVELAGFRIPTALVVMGPIYFVLGYLLYGGLFAAAGAMLGTEQDIQQVMMPLVIPLVIPVVILPGVIDNPDAVWAVAVSLFPFFSPILMVVRLSVGSVPAWQTAASVGLLLVFIWGAALAAGRIYRVGILMKGKPPNLPEVLRWIRYG